VLPNDGEVTARKRKEKGKTRQPEKDEGAKRRREKSKGNATSMSWMIAL
jgi:hypothetical protein